MGLRNMIILQEVSCDMLNFYKLLNQKMDTNLAMICFLLINIVFWFFVGSLSGALIAALLFDRELIVSYAITLGGMSSPHFGLCQWIYFCDTEFLTHLLFHHPSIY